MLDLVWRCLTRSRCWGSPAGPEHRTTKNTWISSHVWTQKHAKNAWGNTKRCRCTKYTEYTEQWASIEPVVWQIITNPSCSYLFILVIQNSKIQRQHKLLYHLLTDSFLLAEIDSLTAHLLHILIPEAFLWAVNINYFYPNSLLVSSLQQQQPKLQPVDVWRQKIRANVGKKLKRVSTRETVHVRVCVSLSKRLHKSSTENPSSFPQRKLWTFGPYGGWTQKTSPDFPQPLLLWTLDLDGPRRDETQ